MYIEESAKYSQRCENTYQTNMTSIGLLDVYFLVIIYIKQKLCSLASVPLSRLKSSN